MIRWPERRPALSPRVKLELSLFEMESDIGESTNLAEKNPEVVERLKKRAEKSRPELGDIATKRQGKGVRPAGKVD